MLGCSKTADIFMAAYRCKGLEASVEVGLTKSITFSLVLKSKADSAYRAPLSVLEQSAMA